MTYYDLTFMDNVTSLNQVVAGVNTNSGGWLGGILLIFSFVLIFIVFSEYDFKEIMFADSFLCSLIAGILFGLQLLPWWGVLPSVVLFFISLLIKVWGE